MKKLISMIITLIVLFSINYVLGKILNLEFLELFAMVGVISSIIIGFFSSKGGLTAHYLDVKHKHFTFEDDTTISESHKLKLYNNTPFMVSIAYTIIGIIATIIGYAEYF
jgi:Na+/H+ antiporter NhaB